jgi:transcriptional regulator with XRE-family HTH domain
VTGLAEAVTFGRRVRREREARGWSASELARRAGLGCHETVYRAERGGATYLHTAAALSAALGIPLAGMLAPAAEPVPPPQPVTADQAAAHREALAAATAELAAGRRRHDWGRRGAMTEKETAA